MLVRDRIRLGFETHANGVNDGLAVALPHSLPLETGSARIGLLRRLSSSRHFALGDRSGVLSAAQRRSGRKFRLDVRQRVVVKALVSRHVGKGGARAGALATHVAYLGRPGAGRDGARPMFFDRREDAVDAQAVTRVWAGDRHHFRFIISPEHGDRIADLRDYVREVMGRVVQDMGEPALVWVAACHFDTDQPHAHVLVRGRRGDGRDLVIPRDYVGYGFRARAQEVAQERLGDLSRLDAERRIWRETQADRFTGLDRRLKAAADASGLVADGVGRHDAWAALTRGRLRHLEALGLAKRVGREYRLAPGLELRLRTLQARRDIIRTFNQRRLEGAKDVRMSGVIPVRGRVVLSGAHDELGASPFVVLRDRTGVEHYGRLPLGQPLPKVGAEFQLAPAAAATPGQDLGRLLPEQGL